MLRDYHVHTQASPDASGAVGDYLQKAVQLELAEIGFSDHVMLCELEGYPHIPQAQIPRYVENLLEVKRNAKLPVKLGVEVDYFPEDTPKIREFIEKYPFDYVIGAVHFIGGWCFDDPKQRSEYLKRDMLEVYRDYFSLVTQMCKTRLFDVVAHFDLIKIFGFKPEGDFSEALTETVGTIAQEKLCVEINTSGLRKPCREIYPNLQILKMLREFDIPIVFGSDAHNPEDLAKNLADAQLQAKKIGYTQTCIFNRRKRTFAEI